MKKYFCDHVILVLATFSACCHSGDPGRTKPATRPDAAGAAFVKCRLPTTSQVTSEALPEEQEVLPGGPALITLKTTNKGIKNLRVESEKLAPGWSIAISAERDGQAIGFSELGRELVIANSFGSAMVQSMPIGVSVSTTIDVSKLFDMSILGKYRFMLTRNVGDMGKTRSIMYESDAIATVIVRTK
jgi:hypothetical protein